MFFSCFSSGAVPDEEGMTPSFNLICLPILGMLCSLSFAANFTFLGALGSSIDGKNEMKKFVCNLLGDLGHSSSNYQTYTCNIIAPLRY